MPLVTCINEHKDYIRKGNKKQQKMYVGYDVSANFQPTALLDLP